MSDLTIPLPEPLNAWVRARVDNGDYASPGDYLGELIRRDRNERETRDAVAAALEAGDASGVSKRRIPDILAALKAERSGRAA